jgi:hypothetical protein
MFTVGDVREIESCPACGAWLFGRRSEAELERLVQERLYGRAARHGSGDNGVVTARKRTKGKSRSGTDGERRAGR